jgi:inorganic triphosphatase YgiF
MRTPAAPGAPREVELKLAVAARDLPLLRQRLAAFGGGETVEIDNVYFDTADRLLRANRMALRVRRIGRRWVQTLKTESKASALSSRGEWEVPAPRGRLDVLRFPQTPLSELLQSHPGAELRPAFRTRFRRTLWQADDGAVEIALDEGEIVAGERRAPILELELELKSGAAERLYRLAQELAGRGRTALALCPAVDSKAVRGYRLAAAEPPTPLKANARAVAGGLTADSTLAAVLRTVVERGTTLLLANAAGISEGGDPEFVHQARVAVRRIRSTARLLGGPAGWPESFDEELRWIGRRLGAVRDWDVLQASTLKALVAAVPEAAPLADAVGAARRRDDAALQAALQSARFASLTLRLLRWSAGAAACDETLGSSAGKRLRRLHRRLFESAAFFVALPVEEQHRVRIRAKRLRYALDLYAAALPAKATARYVDRLAQLQDELGALNDVVVAAGLLPRLAPAGGTEAEKALAWLGAQQQQHALLAEAGLLRLARLRLPWR